MIFCHFNTPFNSILSLFDQSVFYSSPLTLIVDGDVRGGRVVKVLVVRILREATFGCVELALGTDVIERGGLFVAAVVMKTIVG